MSGSNNNNSSSRKRKQGWHSNSGGAGGSGGCKSSNGNISGGNNKYNKKRQQQPYYHNNPPRGGPGILLTCERSREVKCQREGLDIILHYYNSDSSNVNRSNSNSGSSVNPNPSAAGSAAGSAATSDKEAGTASATTKKLTLDEEIATLRQLQKSSSAKGDGDKSSNTPPFTIFETGCQGTVFLICTLPNCHLIPPIRFSSSNNKALVTAVGDGDAEKDDDKETAGVDDPVDGRCSAEKPATSSAASTDKAATASTTTTRKHVNSTAPESVDKQQQSDDHDDAIIGPCDASWSSPPSGPPPWDPVKTVQQVARDIMNTSSSSSSSSTTTSLAPAPSSRFVTRMIPIQVTCFASLDEIQATTAALIHNLVLMKNSNTKKREQQQHEQQTISTDDQESSRIDDEEKQSSSPPTTFRISIKRRNCAHLKSAQVIAAMGATVASVAPGWKVQLTNSPDYTIWVEICKTLAGISILKSSASASSSSSSSFSNDVNNNINNISTLLRFNFNLHEMKTNQEKSSK